MYLNSFFIFGIKIFKSSRNKNINLMFFKLQNNTKNAWRNKSCRSRKEKASIVINGIF